MYKTGSGFLYSPSDLIGFLENESVTWLDRYNIEFPGELSKDEATEEEELVYKSGEEHEARILDSFHSERDLVVIDRSDNALHKTMAAMRQGRQVIYQGRLTLEPFAGWPDFLVRIPGNSEFGDWHYQIWDTKLARGMKPYFAIQVCCYSEMLESAQGRLPEHAGIILGNGERQLLRISDCVFYYRLLKRAFLEQQQLFRPDIPPAFRGRADYRHWTGYVANLLEARNDVSLVANTARCPVASLSRTGHPAHPGSRLWSHSGPHRTPIGSSPVSKLGWLANQKPFARQHLRLAVFNFAEVGFRCRHLILNHQLKSLLTESNFGIQA